MPEIDDVPRGYEILSNIVERTVSKGPLTRAIHIMVQGEYADSLPRDLVEPSPGDRVAAAHMVRALEDAIGQIRKHIDASNGFDDRKVSPEYTLGYLDMARDLHGYLIERSQQREAKAASSKRGAVRTAAQGLSERKEMWTLADLRRDLERANAETTDSNITHALNKMIQRDALERVPSTDLPPETDGRTSWYRSRAEGRRRGSSSPD